MAKLNKNATKWALIHWTENNSTTVVESGTLAQLAGKRTLEEGWKGELPWLENGSLTVYDATIVKMSTNKKLLEALEVSEKGKILSEKEIKPNAHGEKKSLSKQTAVFRSIRSQGQQNLDKEACKALKLSELPESSASDDDIPLGNKFLNKNSNEGARTVQRPVESDGSDSDVPIGRLPFGKKPSSSDQNANKVLAADEKNASEQPPAGYSARKIAGLPQQTISPCARCLTCPCRNPQGAKLSSKEQEGKLQEPEKPVSKAIVTDATVTEV